MTNTFPMTMIAQIDDVAVFQTAAFAHDDIDDSAAKNQRTGFEGQSNYGELNLGLHVNDNALQVLDNRMSLLAAINEQLTGKSAQNEQHVAINRLHWVSQVHGKRIHDVDATTLNMAPMSADAMVSQQSGRGLAIMTADCVPIVLYQPTNEPALVLYS